MRVLVTGGAGFIGSSLVRRLAAKHELMVIDKLTYAGDTKHFQSVSDLFQFRKVDICDLAKLKICFEEFKPEVVCHLAAESHVDNSIESSKVFLETNIMGTFNLLELAREFCVKKFIHVSTDEVYGDLDLNSHPVSESDSYQPSSPYSASKASADHLVRAWGRTYDLPFIITHSTNNYGPYQHSEKFIPMIMQKTLKEESVAVYGDGKQRRDWIYVEDHTEALELLMHKGRIGETYHIGASCERTNLEMVSQVIRALTRASGSHFDEEIEFVEDRKGHDRRYALDVSKIEKELGWKAKTRLEDGLLLTSKWFIKNIS